MHAGEGRRPESSGSPLHVRGTLPPDSPLPPQGHPPRALYGRPLSKNGDLPGAATATACPAEKRPRPSSRWHPSRRKARARTVPHLPTPARRAAEPPYVEARSGRHAVGSFPTIKFYEAGGRGVHTNDGAHTPKSLPPPPLPFVFQFCSFQVNLTMFNTPASS